MSANNVITINKKSFVVKEIDIETRYGNVIGKGKNLEQAVEIAQGQMKEGYVEYGIQFVED